MRIEVLGVDCPVLSGVTVGVQRGSEVLDEHPADGTTIRWQLEARLVGHHDLRGPYARGAPSLASTCTRYTLAEMPPRSGL
ncbi:MAG: DUF5990 family protein [Chloroflexota bacterium]|nr:DUF5990 family protein [Chloroflexota bacterium]